MPRPVRCPVNWHPPSRRPLARTPPCPTGSAPAWAIYAFTGTGSDLLFYLPAARYPERIRGGRLERVGGWAYLHD